MTQQFILASGSPRRREILTERGITFKVIKPDIEEKRAVGETPLDYVARLSREKAQAVADRIGADEGSNVVILAADTTVILAADTLGIQADQILEKPATPEEAREMLRRLRNQPHTVATALTLLKLTSGQHPQRITRVTQSTVWMREYSDAEMEAYIASGEPFDKAGGYAIQDENFKPVARFEGSYSNIVGLPEETLDSMLNEADVTIFS